MRFEWDREKAETNLRKHRVSFDEAASVFLDALSITIPDPDHSVGERRFLTLGSSAGGRLLVVAHTEQRSTIRIPVHEPPTPPNVNAMKPKASTVEEMRTEYDFSKGVRGKYVKRLAKEGSNIAVLDPDVAKAFPNSEAVNEALRVVIKAGQTARRLTTRSSGPGKNVGRRSVPKK